MDSSNKRAGNVYKKKTQSCETAKKQGAFKEKIKREIKREIKHKVKRFSKTKKIAALFIVAIIASLFVYGQNGTGFMGTLRSTGSPSDNIVSQTKVHFIDVGQGDCVLLEQSGEFALIDTGDRYAAEDIVDYLSAQGVETLKYLMLSHPHADHIGSAKVIMETFDVETLVFPKLTPDVVPTTSTFKSVLEAIKVLEINVEVVENKIYPLGSGEIEILSTGAKDPKDNVNDASFVAMFTVENFSYLTTGDAEEQVEIELLEMGHDLKSDLYKMAHHGSKTSNTEELLTEVMPTFAVVSSAEGNSFGHPSQEIVERLETLDIQLLQTAIHGDIVVAPTTNGIEYTTQKG